MRKYVELAAMLLLVFQFVAFYDLGLLVLLGWLFHVQVSW
jgi:hypothetical protein